MIGAREVSPVTSTISFILENEAIYSLTTQSNGIGRSGIKEISSQDFGSIAEPSKDWKSVAGWNNTGAFNLGRNDQIEAYLACYYRRTQLWAEIRQMLPRSPRYGTRPRVPPCVTVLANYQEEPWMRTSAAPPRQAEIHEEVRS